MKFFLSAIAVVIFPALLQAQTSGCTDPQANNFDSLATINNGSCTYNGQSYTPALRANLSSTLREISGIIYFNNKILALNDGGGGNKLYFLDTANGAILQTITVESATNVDWEDLAQDSSFIYVGDFGNNANGNRTNLCIYKIDKTAFAASGDFAIPPSAVQKINYTYPDQINFSPTGANNTRFDCEALTVANNQLHLFTKNWVGNYSVHYSLPTTPGTFAATRLDSLNTGAIMITGADAGAYNEVLFTGYSKTGACAFFLVYGFKQFDSLFVTGNKRQLQLPSVLSSGQLEAVCFMNATRGFIANEYFTQSIFNVSNKLHIFTSTQWIIDYYRQNQESFAEAGMMRFNSSLDKYEVFTGAAWESLH